MDSLKPKLKRFKYLPLIVHLVPWSAYFIYVWTHALVHTKEGIIATNLAHWADGAAHLTYMSAFAYRLNFPLEHPVFANHPFNYSFAVDLLGGLLIRAGVSPVDSYNLVGLVFSLIFLYLLWWFAKKLTRSRWAATLSSTLFLLSGGLGFRYFFLDVARSGLWPVLSKLPRLYTQQEDVGLVWLNTIVGELLPQRAFLLGLIFGLLILGFTYQHFVLREPLKDWQLPGLGVLIGLLPIVHPHTLIFTTFCLISLFSYSLLTAGKDFFTLKICPALTGSKRAPQIILSDWLCIGLPALFIGLTLSSIFILPALGNGFIRVKLGWMAQTKEMNWFFFWLNNWGLFFPLMLLSTLIFFKRKLATLLLPALFAFILGNILLFQPYEWDNAKIFTWVYLLFSIPIAKVLVNPRAHLSALAARFEKKPLLLSLLSALVVLTLTFSALLDVLNTLQLRKNRNLLLSNQEVHLAQQLRENTSPTANVLTATFHRHWVPTLTGRQILLGYRGWIWTYGIDDSDRIRDIKLMYQGGEVAEQLFRRYKVDYVVLGPMERFEFSPNQTYFDANYPLLINAYDTKVYQLDH